jgi:hypothetical protein
MINRIKNAKYSYIFLLLANIAVVFSICHINLNTKSMSNANLLISYTIIGLVTLVLIVLNNATVKHFSK